MHLVTVQMDHFNRGPILIKKNLIQNFWLHTFRTEAFSPILSLYYSLIHQPPTNHSLTQEFIFFFCNLIKYLCTKMLENNCFILAIAEGENILCLYRSSTICFAYCKYLIFFYLILWYSLLLRSAFLSGLNGELHFSFLI